MAMTHHVDIVSAEEEIFSGTAEMGDRARRDGRGRHYAAAHSPDHAPEAG